MLRNELHLFEDIIFLPDAFGNQIINDLLQKCKQIESSWQDAAFSTVMEQTLDRYFQHYLTGISNFSDTLFTLHTGYAPQAQTIILNLIDHLRVYYTPYFNLEMTAPVAYYQRIMNSMRGPVSDLQKRISGSEVSPDLKTCLSDWIQSMSNFDTGIRYSFRSLKYFQILNQELSNLDWNDPLVEALVINLLIQFNFNHLVFFAHMQRIVRSGIAGLSFSTQLTYLEQRNANMLSAPQRIDLIYDTNWPGIQIMLSKWFAEEITLLKIVISKETKSSVKTLPQKLSLNLSVAQLSCLIRLFYEEQIFTTTNLTAIFSFVSTHFQTKKQTAISRASLSKEYYSLDQHTAARVLDIFQKMVFRINRNFFPVAAVVSTIVYGCLGTY